ncbi:hypothetical protein G7046_g6413 [Stylonectria norvegica]|nr:hypothetical protein G7046_g6413 [Stylonectria norvegica]
MMQRSLRTALRPLPSLCASLTKPSMAVTARLFSTSPSRRKFCSWPSLEAIAHHHTADVKAIFTETASPELNAVLKKIQEKIVLPAYLPEEQRELVFDPNKRQYLQQNPVVIELDGLEHKFSTINRFSEVPNSKKILAEALNLMKTNNDWENLGTLLAGYHKANVKTKPRQISKIIRLSAADGGAHHVIEAVKQATKTGLFLNRKEYVVGLLSSINLKIANHKGSIKEAVQAANWNELVFELIQRPEHMNENDLPADRAHFSVLARGQLLYSKASAAKAKQLAGEPFDAELEAVKENVEILSTLLERLDTTNIAAIPEIRMLSPRKDSSSTEETPELCLSQSSFIEMLCQVAKGIELANELVGDAAKSLLPIAEGLKGEVSGSVQSQKRYNDGWAAYYEKIMGEKPNWPQHVNFVPGAEKASES